MVGRLAALAVLFALPLALGCGDDGGTPPPSDSGAPPDIGTRSDSGTSDDGGSPVDSGVSPVAVCLDSVDLDVVTPDGADALPGRLVLAWVQLSDDGPTPDPLVAYDVPFAGGSSSVSIPLAGLTAPNEENLTCARACTDVTTCPCSSEPKVGIGFVAVVTDADGSGAAEPAEILDETGWVAVGYLIVGGSASAHMPAGAPLDGLFPEGILLGNCPYRIIDDGNDPFDALGYPLGTDARFRLNACSAGGCSFQFPNLT